MSSIAEGMNPTDGEDVIKSSPGLSGGRVVEPLRVSGGAYSSSPQASRGSTSASASQSRVSSSASSSSSSSVLREEVSWGMMKPRNFSTLSIVALVLAVLAVPAVRRLIGTVLTLPFSSSSALANNPHYIPGYWAGAGKYALPVIGEPLEFLTSSFAYTLERARKFGHVAMGRPLGYKAVVLSGNDGMKAFYDYGNRSYAFPQQFITGILGGHTILNMQDDATSPRFHERRDAFERALGYRRPAVIDQYLPIINRIISRHLRLWEQQTIRDGNTIRLVDAAHLLCAEIATTIILGIEDGGALARRLLPFISDSLNAGQGAPPLPIPGTYFYRGMTSSRELVGFYATLIEQHVNASGIVVSDKAAVSSYGGVLKSLFPIGRTLTGKGKKAHIPPMPHGLDTLAKRWKSHLQTRGGETLEGLATEVHHTVLAMTALVGNNLADTIIALHRNPDVRKRLAYEVEDLTSSLPWEPERKPYIEDMESFYDFSSNSKGPWKHYDSALLGRMRYNDAVTKEVRRVFPGVPGMFARATQDFTIKSGGYNGAAEHDKVVERGTVMIGGFYATNLDPTLWSEPLTFNPSRFLGANREPLKKPDGRDNDVRFSWVPHGSGAHQCPGMMLVDAVIQLFNVHLVKDGVVWHLPSGQNLEQNLRLFNPEPKSGVLVSRWRATALDSDSF